MPLHFDIGDKTKYQVLNLLVLVISIFLYSFKVIAMSTSFLSFIILSLFMLHELDEIIFIRPWFYRIKLISASKEMFIAGKIIIFRRKHIALMIAEEFC